MTNKSACSTNRAAANTNQNAISVDTSGLASTLKQMAEAQMAEQMQKIREQTKAQVINPVATVADVSARMSALYGRYEKLQEIGKLLNGVPLSDPIPENLIIEDIAITFRTVDPTSDTGYSDFKTATVKNVICAGDIYKLLSGEMGVLILTLEQEMKALHALTGQSETQYEKARKQWETANPDRQIKAITPSELSANS